MELMYALIIILIAVLIYYFRDELTPKSKPVEPVKEETAPVGEPIKEHLQTDPTPETAKQTLKLEGYSDNMQWQDVIKATDLDPSTFDNHKEFIKETRRYSSGANFTSTTDDNISPQMVNFIGLRRPSSVPIHPGRRQVEDLQYDVFDRNKQGEIRWGQGVYIRNDSGEHSGGENDI